MQTYLAELSDVEIPQMCALFQQVFGIAVTPEQWRWKYQAGPRLGGVNMVVRDVNGELLGHAGASVFPGVCGGVPLAMAQICDLLLAKSVRGGMQSTSVYSQLFQSLQNATSKRFGAAFGYGFAGPRVYKLGRRRGFYSPEQLYHPACFDKSARQRLPRLWSVDVAGWDTRRLDRIWSQYMQNFPHPKVSRTGAYLHWRYTSNPMHSYQLWVIRHCSRDRGWFITRQMPNGQIYVVDVLSPSGANLQILTATLVHELKRTGWGEPPVVAWHLPEGNRSSIDPVLAGEFRLTDWHSSLPAPVFHPGDTDVY